MNAEFSMGARLSPVMSRAPSKTVTPVVRVWPPTRPGQVTAKNRHATTAAQDDVFFTRRIKPPFEIIWFERK
jgi:hypothetical protein